MPTHARSPGCVARNNPNPAAPAPSRGITLEGCWGRGAPAGSLPCCAMPACAPCAPGHVGSGGLL
eukprot:359194-Chlamydomonas_euryale.AAC.3